MKKLISLLLTLVLLALPALAEDEHAHDAHVFAPEGSGIALTMDDEWFHALAYNLYGTIDRSTADPCDYSDLFFVYVNPEDETVPEDGILLFALSNRIIGSEHEPNTLTFAPFALSQSLFSENDRELLLWYNDPASLPEHLAGTLMLPVDRLLNNPGDVSISEPTPMPVASGFDNLHGINAVDQSPVGAEVLSGKKLIMVNIWATYCNPCIKEMPDLAQLNKDFAAQGFQIIGIISDAGAAETIDSDTLAYANVIIDSTGANYLHVVPGEGMFYGVLGDITAVPTTYFIDEHGNQVGDEYVGSRDYAGWAAIVNDLLASME